MGSGLDIRRYADSVLDIWYNLGYTNGMKTAISVPDKVFESAEQLARRIGLSRSELYVTALVGYLKEHNEDRLVEKLNEVYGGAAKLGLDPHLQSMQARTVRKSGKKW